MDTSPGAQTRCCYKSCRTSSTLENLNLFWGLSWFKLVLIGWASLAAASFKVIYFKQISGFPSKKDCWWLWTHALKHGELRCFQSSLISSIIFRLPEHKGLADIRKWALLLGDHMWNSRVKFIETNTDTAFGCCWFFSKCPLLSSFILHYY